MRYNVNAGESRHFDHSDRVACILLTNSSLKKTIEQDLDFAIGIADRLVGTKIGTETYIRGRNCMDFKRLTDAGGPFFAEAFALYETSFPERERRVLDRQAAVMVNPSYHFDVIAEGGAFTGILFWWELSGYAYIEHFAIPPSIRGKSLGSRSLKAFCEANPAVVLEIDPPVDEISVRRQGFYHRLGFQTNGYEHLHPAYRKPFLPHPLVVMSYPSQMTEREYQLFQMELGEIVMKDCAF